MKPHSLEKTKAFILIIESVSNTKSQYMDYIIININFKKYELIIVLVSLSSPSWYTI